MLSATELSKGAVIRWEGKIYVVFSTLHVTKGNKRGFVQVKMREMESGSMIENKFGSDDRFERVTTDTKPMEYLYLEGENLVFMDQQNYEQVSVHKDVVAADMRWLKENTPCKLNFCDGKAIGIELPTTVDLKIVETEPSLKSATVTNVYKAAKLETGATVDVPPFIENGEVIRIDTRDGTYVGRSNA